MKNDKKITAIALASMFLVTGCNKVEEKGDYKEGTYFGYAQAESYGKMYYTTAVVYVNENGKIKSVFVDNTYSKDEAYTTKKILRDDYGMKDASASAGNIEGGAEWYEQAAVIEEKVLEEQGLSWVELDDSNKLDGVSGVTITANTYIEALEEALKQAK